MGCWVGWLAGLGVVGLGWQGGIRVVGCVPDCAALIGFFWGGRSTRVTMTGCFARMTHGMHLLQEVWAVCHRVCAPAGAVGATSLAGAAMCKHIARDFPAARLLNLQCACAPRLSLLEVLLGAASRGALQWGAAESVSQAGLHSNPSSIYLLIAGAVQCTAGVAAGSAALGAAGIPMQAAPVQFACWGHGGVGSAARPPWAVSSVSPLGFCHLLNAPAAVYIATGMNGAAPPGAHATLTGYPSAAADFGFVGRASVNFWV